MKKILLFLYILFIELNTINNASGQQIIKTPTGKNVPYEYEEEMSDSLKAVLDAYWQNKIIDNKWDAEIIGSSSAQYNCHGYAWHVSDGGNYVLINSPESYFSGDSTTYVQTTNTYDSLRKIVYFYEYAGGHSAISTNEEGYVISKWGGAGPLVRHAIFDFPWLGDSIPDSATFYEIDIEGNDNISVGGSLNLTTLNITNATYNWSGDDYYICGTGNSYVGTIIGLKETPAYIRAPVKVEITSPYSNTTIKGDRKNYISVSSGANLPYISATGGSKLVCSSGTSFEIYNLPPGWAIEWICGPFLSRVTAQGSNPCTFSSTGSGSSWVNAIVHPACGGIELERYNVWSGLPQVWEVTGPSNGCSGSEYTFYADYSPYSNPTSFEWSISPEYYCNTIYGYDWWANAHFDCPYEEYYQVRCTPQNACGKGDMANTIYDCGYGYSLSPNPASTEVTITVSKTINSLNIAVENIIFDISIYDSYGVKHFQGKYSGDRFTIPVYNLKDGSYIMKIDDGNFITKKQLIIKH